MEDRIFLATREISYPAISILKTFDTTNVIWVLIRILEDGHLLNEPGNLKFSFLLKVN